MKLLQPLSIADVRLGVEGVQSLSKTESPAGVTTLKSEATLPVEVEKIVIPKTAPSIDR